MATTESQSASAQRLAVSLGWFSVGLGLTELLAPALVARIIGVRPTRATQTTLRALGLREISSGLGIFARPDSALPMWSRVAGDAMDLALLSTVFGRDDAQRGMTTFATAAVLGVTAADVLCATELSAEQQTDARSRAALIEASASVTILRPIGEVYQFWQNFENFPRFMRNLESVEVVADGRSRWTALGPANQQFDWEAEIISDQENHLISWRSVPGSTIENRGAVRFEPAPGGRGTEVHVELAYRPPAGRLGHAAAWIFGKTPRQDMREGLRRVKQMIEIGEVMLSDGLGLSRPGQPAEDVQDIRTLAGVQS